MDFARRPEFWITKIHNFSETDQAINPVILSVTYHRQNPLDSSTTCFDLYIQLRVVYVEKIHVSKI
jgi:hypothetical protein